MLLRAANSARRPRPKGTSGGQELRVEVVETVAGVQPTDAKDRILLVVAALALVVLLGWYVYALAIARLGLGIPGNVATYLFTSVAIPTSAITILVLTVGWGIQTHHPRSLPLFYAFVFIEILAWAAGLAAARSSGTDAGTALSNVSMWGYSIGLFLLLVLVLPRRPLEPVEEESPTPPEEPAP